MNDRCFFFPFTYKFSNEYFSSSILHPGGASRVSQVDGGSDVAPAWQLFAERDHQRNNGLCQHFCLGGSHLPPTLTLMPDNSVPPRVSLAPFKWLELRRVSWREPMRSPLKGTAWDSRSPLSPSTSIPAGFYSQKFWGLLFLALEPQAGGPEVGLGSLTPQGEPPQPRHPSQFLSAICGCETSLFLVSAPPTSLNVASSTCP